QVTGLRPPAGVGAVPLPDVAPGRRDRLARVARALGVVAELAPFPTRGGGRGPRGRRRGRAHHRPGRGRPGVGRGARGGWGAGGAGRGPAVVVGRAPPRHWATRAAAPTPPATTASAGTRASVRRTVPRPFDHTISRPTHGSRFGRAL